MSKLTTFLLGIFAAAPVVLAEDPQLVVHEWGTFTTLQDPHGRQLGAINEDTESLPQFVKNLIPSERGIKGFPVHQHVTMRLETPVVYFHLPPGAPPMKLDYSASFKGGFLTQYYPDAEHNYSHEQYTGFGTKEVTGKLTWKNITIGKPQPGPTTDSKIWLAPRNVNAADVTTEKGEAERYLFYRGVGHLQSPVRVQTSETGLKIFQNEIGASYAPIDQLTPDKFWFVEIDDKNTLQYYTIEAKKFEPDKPIATFSAPSFPHREMLQSTTDLRKVLRSELKSELIKQGLFEDEADSMLNTWEESYFKSTGQRVLFVVPKKWVDFYLPVNVSVPAKIERVMIGRIDLVTESQIAEARAYLEKVKLPIEMDMTITTAQSVMQSMTAMPTEPLPKLGRFTNAILWDTHLRKRLGVDSSIKR